MKKVKKFNVEVIAFELGGRSSLEQELITQGKIIKNGDSYEIFSTESDSSGEVAKLGDFVKIDQAKNPYPNDRERFLNHHIHVGGNEYKQFPQIIDIWKYGDEEDEVIQFLLDSGKLIINHDSRDKFYEAKLWGTTLFAKKSDIVLTYQVKKEASQIEDVDFNLIDKDEFDKTYEYIN